MVSDPGLRAQWQARRPGYGGSAFAAFVDGVIAKLPPDTNALP
jgi:hypothetical protein